MVIPTVTSCVRRKTVVVPELAHGKGTGRNQHHRCRNQEVFHRRILNLLGVDKPVCGLEGGIKLTLGGTRQGPGQASVPVRADSADCSSPKAALSRTSHFGDDKRFSFAREVHVQCNGVALGSLALGNVDSESHSNSVGTPVLAT